MESIVEFDGIGKRFFNVTVLRDVSFPVIRGHILGLVGENGAGKSTLMNILGGVIAADSGVVRVDGKDLILKNPQQAAERGISFIHQELNLFPNLTIAENLFIPHFPKHKIAGLGLINRRDMREQAKKCLLSVGLDLSPDIVVADLNPGERQLVEIAKALNADARVVIFGTDVISFASGGGTAVFAYEPSSISGNVHDLYFPYPRRCPEALRRYLRFARWSGCSIRPER